MSINLKFETMGKLYAFLFALVLLAGCGKDPNPPGPGPDPEPPPGPIVKKEISISFDLALPSADALKIPSTRGGLNNIRFRMLYEIKPENGELIRGSLLHEISSSAIELKESLEYGKYTIAVFGNYVEVDGKGEITDEQYRADPTAGLQKISIVDPVKEKQWAFAYAGRSELNVEQTTGQVRMPVKRCIMQLQFNPHKNGIGVPPSDAVAADITLSGFSTLYNAHTGKASDDAAKPIIQLNNIASRQSPYYTLTLFESEDCELDIEYINSDQTRIRIPTFKGLIIDQELRAYKYFCNFTHPISTIGPQLYDGKYYEAFCAVSSRVLAGDNFIFEPSPISRVKASDSLALVDFFRAMNGESWSPSWNLLLPVSTWGGVELSVRSSASTEQRVIGINFDKWSWSSGGTSQERPTLQGTLPASVGNLSALKKLALYGDIEGIEFSLDAFPDLEYLSILRPKKASQAVPYLPVRLPESSALREVKLAGIALENLNALCVPQMRIINIENCRIPEGYAVFHGAEALSGLEELSMLTWTVTPRVYLSDDFYKIGPALKKLVMRTDLYDWPLETRIHLEPTLSRMITAFPNVEEFWGNLAYQQIPGTIRNWTKLVRFNCFDPSGVLPVELFELPVLESVFISNDLTNNWHDYDHLHGTIPQHLVKKLKSCLLPKEIVIE